MELVYLWVEKYKNIHEQEFNFSSRFTCDYDGKELSIKENDDYIENFFGDNVNITAIVGKNGSGKSSVLNAIINSKQDDPTMKQKYILVYSSGKQRYYHSNFELKTSLDKSNDSKFITYLDRKNNDTFPINMGATPLSNLKKSRNFWLNYNEIDISKNVIINLLAIEIGKIDPDNLTREEIVYG